MNSVIDKICGWELNNPDPEIFETQLLTPPGESEKRVSPGKCPGSCWSCEFLLECIGQSQLRCLVPRDCELYEIGREKSDDGSSVTYFASKKGDKVTYFRLTEPASSWAGIRNIREDEVPDRVLSRMES